MGLGDKIKEFLRRGNRGGESVAQNPKTKTKLEKIGPQTYSISILETDEIIFAEQIEKIGSCTHRDGVATDIMMARLIKQPSDWAMIPDMFDYVAFEVSKGATVTDEIMQKIMEQYGLEKQPNINKKHYYLGHIIEGKDGNVVLGNKSSSIEVKTRRIVQEREAVGKGQVIGRDSEIPPQQVFKNGMDARPYVQECQEARKARKQRPTLESIFVPEYQKAGTKKSYSYDGVNVNTGEILRIRGLESQGKDGSGTHLYFGYIYNTENEDDADLSIEQITQMKGTAAVCFELPKSLTDIVRDENQDEIKRVLQLLSDERNFGDDNKLKYIGGVDKDWKVTRNEKPSSLAIQLRIEQLRTKFGASENEAAITK